MQKLYLVGFTTDLRGLVLSRQKGVKSGGFVVDLDDQLRAALDEVYRRHGNGGSRSERVPAGIPKAAPEPEVPPEDPAGQAKPRKRPARSVLTPKEIQAELRSGKTVQEVARMAGTDISWIERFLSPILAERKGIVDSVMSGFIARPRRGRSSCNVGQAIVANLKERKIPISPEDLEEGWSVARSKGQWEVTFRYALRGQDKQAHFAYNLETGVTAMNADASVIGWRPPVSTRTGEGEDGPEGETPRIPPVPLKATAAAAKPRPKAKPVPRRDVASATAALWGATKVTPPTAPARRSSFIGVGKADAPAGPSKPVAKSPAKAVAKPAAKSPAKAAARPKPVPPGRSVQPGQPAKRLPGAADDRPVFARNSSSPRPKRLITLADDEADWRSAVAKSRAKREAGTPGPQPGPTAPKSPAQPRAQPPRPQRKRLPDDWLIGE